MQNAEELKAIERRLHPPMVEGKHTFGTVSDKIGDLTLKKKTPFHWFIGLGISFLIAQLLLFTVVYLVVTGIGIWGNNQPIGWAFDIINFVWWVGIGHAGTLISAILLLLNQKWLTSINRFAEAMTLFAVACAGLYPLLHTGRPWLAYWLFPYPNTMGLWPQRRRPPAGDVFPAAADGTAPPPLPPPGAPGPASWLSPCPNTMGLWPQWRSPLMWDVFAVSTYGTVSLLFWYVGLIPDLATLRDRAKNKVAKYVYAVLSLGWRGSTIHWSRYTV